MKVDYVDPYENPAVLCTGEAPWHLSIEEAHDRESGESVGYSLVIFVGGFDLGVPLYTARELHEAKEIMGKFAPRNSLIRYVHFTQSGLETLS